MQNYLAQTTEIIEFTTSREARLPLLNPECRSRFFFHPYPTSKVFLFFHGFTAAPYQFEPMGKALYEAGYNVLIPLLPGHGQAGDWNNDNPPPLPTDVRVYKQFALEWLQQAQSLGERVIVGGLSANAILAAWLALEHFEKCDRALLFAPYLSGTNSLVDLAVEFLPFYYEWLNKNGPGHFGYDGFRIPSLRIFLDLAEEITQQVETNPAVPPILIITSESDLATNQNDQKALFKALLKRQQKCWYHCFKKALKIPHTMMTKLEGNEYEDLLISMTKAFVESDITWTELEEIATRMNQGKTYSDAVAELNLTKQISPDLPSMMKAYLLY